MSNKSGNNVNSEGKRHQTSPPLQIVGNRTDALHVGGAEMVRCGRKGPWGVPRLDLLLLSMGLLILFSLASTLWLHLRGLPRDGSSGTVRARLDELAGGEGATPHTNRRDALPPGPHPVQPQFKLSDNNVVVLVMSVRNAVERRKAIRETWARGHLDVFFMVGDRVCDIPPSYRTTEFSYEEKGAVP